MKIFIIILLLFYTCFSQTDTNCFTIIVGKNASADGSVLLAHNEDDAGELLVDIHKTERDNPDRFNPLNKTDIIKNHKAIYSYLWLEIPGQHFADGFLNEFGVALCSNASRSKETNGRGEIGYYLRKTIMARAKSAREAVRFAGKIIETYGYAHSGRTYGIADANEAWVLEIVNGKHWVAQRIPDDEIVVIPNYYVIGKINLNDTVNYLGSPDLIEYTIEQGWYQPQTGKEFLFKNVYGTKKRQTADYNIHRRWIAIKYLSKKNYALEDDFPFSFKPKKKVTLRDLSTILKNHFEKTEFDLGEKNPHKNKIRTLCADHTQYSFIAQLRNWLPGDIGNVLWFAPRRSCVQPFIPIYFGINTIPEKFEKEGVVKSQAYHFDEKRELKTLFPDHASWIFSEYAKRIDRGFRKKIEKISNEKDLIESELFNYQGEFEKKVVEVYGKDKEKARDLLTGYTTKQLNRLLLDAQKRIK